MDESKIVPVEFGRDDLDKIEALKNWLRRQGVDQSTSAVIRYAVRRAYAAAIEEGAKDAD